MLGRLLHLTAHTRQSKAGVHHMGTTHLETQITSPERTRAATLNLQPMKAVEPEGSRTQFLGQSHPCQKQMWKKRERKEAMEPPQDLPKPETKTNQPQILIAQIPVAVLTEHVKSTNLIKPYIKSFVTTWYLNYLTKNSSYLWTCRSYCITEHMYAAVRFQITVLWDHKHSKLSSISSCNAKIRI